MKYKSDKGVAGLTLLLSIIVTLFVIGLLVMVFSIMGGKLRDATYDPTLVVVTNESHALTGTGNFLVNGYSALGFSSWNASRVMNGSTIAGGNQTLLEGTDYRIYQNGSFFNLTTTSGVRVTYSYTYDQENTGTQVINDTTSSIGGVTDWFDIFIVITAMVVLVLLVVLIINAIRGSGLIADGGNKGATKVGTA